MSVLDRSYVWEPGIELDREMNAKSCSSLFHIYQTPITCYPGEGNGNSVQYSCLGNPMERGAWWATVRGVAKSQMRLSDWILVHSVLRYLVYIINAFILGGKRPMHLDYYGERTLLGFGIYLIKKTNKQKTELVHPKPVQ